MVGLSDRGFRFTVVSFEKAATASPAELATVAGITEAAGIAWKPLRYHRRPRVLSTAYDVLNGWREGRKYAEDVRLIHARSTVPALMARLLSARLGVPWIFDLRGLLAQEYVDAGHWRKDGWVAKLTAAAEKSLLRSAHGLVTLTHRVAEELPPARASHRRPVAVVPCSVDLGVFRPSEEWRRSARGDLGWGDETVLVYSGSLGSWYRLDEMLDFFVTAAQSLAPLRLLLLTPHVETAQMAIGARGLGSRVVARRLAPDDVPRYLAAADAGICFLGRHPSKVASSPTKYAEYLAAGLPVVTNGWIGDSARLGGEAPWILVEEFSQSAYQQAAERLAVLLASPGSTRDAARALATREFGLEAAINSYEALYRRVLNQ
jgi:glycosyltransferase involved in cell wall biosynthesis